MVAACGPLGHVAPNDTDLPRPSTAAGKMMEDCKFGSWGICEGCHSMCPRPLQPTDLRNVKKPTVPAKQCTACQHGEYVPQPGDVPKPLQGLKPRVLEALRPLEMDIGNAERVPHGYRVHSAMMAFAWKPKGVATAVEDLPKKKDRKAGRAALEFLLGSTDSGYNDILQQHEQFLDKHGLNADVKAARGHCGSSKPKAWSVPYGHTSTGTETSAKRWQGHRMRRVVEHGICPAESQTVTAVVRRWLKERSKRSKSKSQLTSL